MNTHSDLIYLVGIQRKILYFIFQRCLEKQSLSSGAISRTEILNAVDCSPDTIKNSINRLISKGFLISNSFKTGRGGWASYTIPSNVYDQLLKSLPSSNTSNSINKEKNKEKTEKTLNSMKDNWVRFDHTLPPHDSIVFLTDGHQRAIAHYYNGEIILFQKTCDRCHCEQCVNARKKTWNFTHWIEIKEPELLKKEKFRSVNPLLKLKVLKRDKFKCNHCGISPAIDKTVELQIDHIYPFSKGGTHDIENLQTLCRECNYKKGNEVQIKTPC